jgi:hypothetical protein
MNCIHAEPGKLNPAATLFYPLRMCVAGAKQSYAQTVLSRDIKHHIDMAPELNLPNANSPINAPARIERK